MEEDLKVKEAYFIEKFRSYVDKEPKDNYYYPYSVGEILFAHAKKMPKELIYEFSEFINSVYQGSLYLHLSFSYEFLNNTLFPLTFRGIYDDANIPYYEQQLENLKYIYEISPELLKDIFREPVKKIHYCELGKVAQRFTIHLRRTLFECMSFSENDMCEIIGIFDFIGCEDVLLNHIKQKEDTFIDEFSKWLMGLLDDFHYYDKSLRLRAEYFANAICIIAPFVGFYRSENIVEKVRVKAFRAVSPMITKLHDIYDTQNKLYSLWNRLTSGSAEGVSKLLWLFKRVLGYKIRLNLSEERAMELVSKILRLEMLEMLESFELIDEFYYDKNINEPLMKNVLNKMLDYNNSELLIMAGKKGFFNGIDIEAVIKELRSYEYENTCFILPCLIALGAKERSNNHD